MSRGRPSKKQAILTTAQRLFSESGYQGTSIDLVVKESNSSKPTVYNNFPTKQALLHELLKQAIEEATLFRTDLRSSADISVTTSLIRAFSHIIQTPLQLAIYRICYGERHKLDEESRQLFKNFEDSLTQWFKEQLQASQGQITDDKVFTIRAICREGLIIPAISGEKPVPEEQLVQIIEAILNG
ncbi:TetR/AcrR family transcriptional regulator [Oceanospirillum sediminis]|uniref:TetR/AcrR family transcriptional regulator n=1 Tax=Oceanospirillum sediminis TaxID=2760088 RepID=A0A839IZN6_9GAMM|nr:TetR/AcrR family transcriptional regulator [Oceanospirillum sediminis]MBB1489546.1 TetR/AcrR family transcriptional regulator [Oceanospirillum sediminis]